MAERVKSWREKRRDLFLDKSLRGMVHDFNHGNTPYINALHADLARELLFTRKVVREAIKRLEGDGFLIHYGWKHVVAEMERAIPKRIVRVTITVDEKKRRKVKRVRSVR